MPTLEIRLRPSGPWRAGQSAGDRTRVDSIYHSDSLYSAVTHAMKTLGWLEEWLAATAQALTPPAVIFSSLFPFSGDARLISPPRNSWPPAGTGKLYLRSARFVPLDVARNGMTDDSRWFVDGPSECLLPAGASSPFEISVRPAAAVDRITGIAEPHRIACLEFAPNAGFWGLVEIRDEEYLDEIWQPRVKAALRLVADSGFGGERSRGWGRAAEPEFTDVTESFTVPAGASAWWMLSLYSPHEEDVVDWARGDYLTIARGGWTDSSAGSVRKKSVRMVEEGSVLIAAGGEKPRGRAVDVAPDGFSHPAWRAGFAFAAPAPADADGRGAT